LPITDSAFPHPKSRTVGVIDDYPWVYDLGSVGGEFIAKLSAKALTKTLNNSGLTVLKGHWLAQSVLLCSWLLFSILP
jgi:hypothetical protein